MKRRQPVRWLARPGVRVCAEAEGVATENEVRLVLSLSAGPGRGAIGPEVITSRLAVRQDADDQERATDAVMAVSGAARIDERTVAATCPSLAALRSNLGCLRAPEMATCAGNRGLEQITGSFTRLGQEPYESKATCPVA